MSHLFLPTSHAMSHLSLTGWHGVAPEVMPLLWFIGIIALSGAQCPASFVFGARAGCNWYYLLPLQLPLQLHLLLAGAPFVFGALLMLVAIGIAWTIDGVSGQRLMLQHQQQNLHLDDDVAPLGDFDEETGE